MRVAIVCDWLLGVGGGERVVLELHRMFPDAPIYTSQYDPQKLDGFTKADVRTTWLQKVPGKYKKFLPVLRAWSFSRLKLEGYDLVISAGGSEAKFIKTKGKTKHIYYCYTPTHYYWSRYDEYMQNPGFGGALNWLARLGLKLLVGPMRRWDYKAAQRPDYIIGISTHIQKEIKKYYGRDAGVIHPPVDTSRFSPQPSALSPTQNRSGFVIAGRQTPYKRFDLAVAACTKLQLPLLVIGDGPEHKKLQALAGPSVTFLTTVTDQQMPKYFQNARAFIFPGLDDFGITPVEAMAAGTPVIAYKAGGALDYVVPGKTGEFFEKQTADSLKQALKLFKPERFNPKQIATHAHKFDPKVFGDKLIKLIESTAK